MNIFLDSVSPQNVIILFDNDKNIIDKYEFNVLLNESSKLIFEIDNYLKSKNIDYKDIKNIVLVSGPGSFTWIRSTTIVVNTIAFVYNCNLTDITYFDLFDSFPIIKKSSKRDSFIKKTETKEVEVFANPEIISYLQDNNINQFYWDFDLDGILKEPKYDEVIKKITLKNEKIIYPNYFKKPSIT